MYLLSLLRCYERERDREAERETDREGERERALADRNLPEGMNARGLNDQRNSASLQPDSIMKRARESYVSNLTRSQVCRFLC